MVTVDGINIERVFDIGLCLDLDSHCVWIEFWHDERFDERLTDLEQLKSYEWEHHKHDNEDIDYVRLTLPIGTEIHFKSE